MGDWGLVQLTGSVPIGNDCCISATTGATIIIQEGFHPASLQKLIRLSIQIEAGKPPETITNS